MNATLAGLLPAFASLMLPVFILEAGTVNPVAPQQPLQLNIYYNCNGERIAVLRCGSDADDAYCSVQYPDRKGPATKNLTPELVEKRGDVIRKLQACGALAPSQPANERPGITKPSGPDIKMTSAEAAAYDAYFKLANKYLAAKQYDQAIEAYKKAIAVLPLVSYAHNGLGLAFVGLKKYQEGVAELKEAIRLEPGNATAYFNLGTTYVSLKEYPKAVTTLQQLIRLKPDYNNAHSFLGIAYKAMKEFDKAATAYREAVRLKPGDADAWASLGFSLYYLKLDSEAVLAFQQSIRLDPKNTYAYRGLGFAYVGLGRKEDAMAVYRTLLKLDKNLEAQEVYDSIKEATSSQPSNTSGTAKRPSNAEVAQPADWADYATRGDEYYQAKDYVRAIDDYKQAIFLQPDLGTFYGLVSGSSENPANDQQWLNAVMRHQRGKPTDFMALILLGDAHRNLNHSNEAVAAYRRAISLKPDSDTQAKAHFRIAQVYADSLQQYEQAFVALTEALRLKPKDTSVIYLLGETYFNLKQFPNALAAFQNLARLNPNHRAAPYWIGKTYNALGQFEKAVGPLQDALRDKSHFNSANASNELGIAFFSLKQYANAAAAFQQAIRLKLDNDKTDFAAAQKGLGLTYLALGQKNRALQVHRTLLEQDPKLAAQLLVEINKVK